MSKIRVPVYRDVISVRYSENGEVAFINDLTPDKDGRVNPLYDPPNFPEPWGRQVPIAAALSMEAFLRGTEK